MGVEGVGITIGNDQMAERQRAPIGHALAVAGVGSLAVATPVVAVLGSKLNLPPVAVKGARLVTAAVTATAVFGVGLALERQASVKEYLRTNP